MPILPPRACAAPGCRELISSGSYCALHQASARRRAPGQQRFYSSSYWRALSQLVRRQEPICALCRSRPSEIADHIDGDWRNNRRENLRALCRDCERSRTGEQHRAKLRDA